MNRLFTLLSIGILTFSTSGLYACYEPMPDDLFDHYYHDIVLTHGEGHKLEMARQLVRHNCVTTLQVADLMELLQGGGNRLGLARAAYNSTVDPEGYMLLVDLVYGLNNRQALLQFIRSRERNRNRGSSYRGQRDYDDDWDDHYDDDWDDDRWDDDDRYRGNRGRGRGQARGNRGQGRGRGRAVQTRYVNPFDEVVLILRSERDPSRREIVARRFVSSHRVCTEEVIFLMNHLNGPQRMMSFAKYSYSFVSDPFQYRQVIGHIPGRSRQAEFRTWLHWQRR